MQLTKQRKQAYILMLINVLIWGASLPIVKNALDHTSPFRYLLYRFTIAIVLSSPIIIYQLYRLRNKFKISARIVLIELFGVTLNVGLLYWGLSKTSSIETGLITSAAPIFTIIGGIIFLKEKEERNELFGLFLALIGTLILVLLPLFYGSKFEFSIEGNIILIGHSIVNAAYAILTKKYYRNVPKMYAASLSYYVGIVSFFIISLISAGSISGLGVLIENDLTEPSVVFASGYMAIFGSIIALTSYLKAQSMIEASEATLFGYLQPTIYIPLGILWLGETITTPQIVALGIIMIGVFWASRRKKN